MTLRKSSGVLPAVLAWAALAAERPNVVLIISDDHGWTDYGFMGHPAVKTPYIDRLAAGSLTFTRGYVPTSLCRPSLASIMTGLWPHQHRITGNDPPGNARDPANRTAMVNVFRESRSLAGLMQASGYVSHQSGKWWEGDCVCCGFTVCMTHGDVSKGGRHGDDGLRIGRQTMQPIFDFIDKAEGKPFFLWYAPFLPHTPHNPPERLLKQFTTPGRAVAVAKYYAMIAWLDETVGQLLDYLDRKGLAQNTVVAYLADNGWVQLEGQQPLFDTRAKLSPYDAGVRTPILVRYPARIKPKRDEETLASSIDLAPTILAAAGLKVDPGMPGINLMDVGKLARRKAVYGSIFVHTSLDIRNPVANLKYRWMVRGRYKIISPHQPMLKAPIWEGQPATHWGIEDEVYDVLADSGERKNLARERADLVQSLRQDLDRWWKLD